MELPGIGEPGWFSDSDRVSDIFITPKPTWGQNMINFKALLNISRTRLGLCRISHPYVNVGKVRNKFQFMLKDDAYEIRTFLTYYNSTHFNYADSYSCSLNETLVTKYENTHHESLHYFDTYTKTIEEYVDDDRYFRLDVDLRTLLKSGKSKVQLIEYIDSLRIETIPEVIYTHCVLNMNIYIINNSEPLSGYTKNMNIDLNKYKIEIEEMKNFLKTMISDGQSE